MGGPGFPHAGREYEKRPLTPKGQREKNEPRGASCKRDRPSYLQMIDSEIEFLPKAAEMIEPITGSFVALGSFFLVPWRDALHGFVKKILHLPELVSSQ